MSVTHTCFRCIKKVGTREIVYERQVEGTIPAKIQEACNYFAARARRLEVLRERLRLRLHARQRRRVDNRHLERVVQGLRRQRPCLPEERRVLRPP